MSGFDRRDPLARPTSEELDVLVVGGGTTAAGVALGTIGRGLRAALADEGRTSGRG
jgi:glycerol-3-phosphate dehydrogenase